MRSIAEAFQIYPRIAANDPKRTKRCHIIRITLHDDSV